MTLRKLLLTLIILFSPFLAIESMAAGMGMGPPPPCGGPFPPCPIPLDSGVLFLLLAGMAYGGYKIYNSFKKNPA
ncbi:MAG: hypothetical protein JWO44_1565 [Bacteroidetes bacterium]|nr:hypothetical protein [Bacteroidota bacterium]